MKKPSLIVTVSCAVGVLALLSVSFGFTTSAHAVLNPTFEYPDWNDLKRSQQEERKKNEKVSEITVLLDKLESQTAAAGDQAVAKSREYAESRVALADARRKLEKQELQTAQAREKSDEVARSVRKLVVRQYKMNGGLPVTSYNLRLDANFEDNKDRAVEQYLLDKRQKTFVEHEKAYNAVEALTRQQRSVKDEYEALARHADDSYDSALEAHRDAEERVASAKRQQRTLLEQLAFLKNTSVELEFAYRKNERERIVYQQQQASREQAAQREAGQEEWPGRGGPNIDATPPQGSNGTGQGEQLPEETPPPVTAPPEDNSPNAAKEYAKNALGTYGWRTTEQFGCLAALWERESNWRVYATNPYSGAYGIPQALPGSKMASAGVDWRTSAATQIRWGLGYIKDRYGSPCAAWEHSQLVGWY